MKRLISFVLAFVMVVCALPMAVIAEEIQENGVLAESTTIASGYCGGNAKWTLYENGLLIISGSGRMNNYNNYADFNP